MLLLLLKSNFYFAKIQYSTVHFISFYYNFANSSMEYTTFSNKVPKHLKDFDKPLFLLCNGINKFAM